jgi:hypothetical protein
MGGSGKAEGLAQALPMADGPTIGKLSLSAATRTYRFRIGGAVRVGRVRNPRGHTPAIVSLAASQVNGPDAAEDM